jgi:hypothetical protein
MRKVWLSALVMGMAGTGASGNEMADTGPALGASAENIFTTTELPLMRPQISADYWWAKMLRDEPENIKEEFKKFANETRDACYYGLTEEHYPAGWDYDYVKFVYDNMNKTLWEVLAAPNGEIIADRMIHKRQVQQLINARNLWNEIWGCPTETFLRSYVDYLVNEYQNNLDPPYVLPWPEGVKYYLTAKGKEKVLRVNKILHYLSCDMFDLLYVPRVGWLQDGGLNIMLEIVDVQEEFDFKYEYKYG